MIIRGFVWLERILDKLHRKHHLSRTEVEDVFAGSPQYRRLENGKVEGENVYAAYGRTDAGRHVTVVFVRKFNGLALIITARDMDRKERRQYGD